MNPSLPPVSETAEYLQAIRQRVATIVVGQDVVVERMLIALLTSGHLLLEGMPGLAKTLLVNTLAQAMHLHFRRIQFTIDLLPSDIIGSEILDERNGSFRVHQGPVFTNLLLADEINRAAPKVQGALLEAMQERKVTIGNQSFPLPVPFLVIATQNPIEQSGTFELPEAQLDRFMLCHRLGYPPAAEEVEILRRNLKLGVKREGTDAVASAKLFFMEMMENAGWKVFSQIRTKDDETQPAVPTRQEVIRLLTSFRLRRYRNAGAGGS